MNKSHLFIIIGTWLAIHLLLIQYPGLRFDLFDSKCYRIFGHNLIEHGTLQKSSYIFYSFPILLVGVFDSFSHGLTMFIIFQSIISLAATLALYKAASTLFSQERAGLIASMILLFWWDNIQWNTALLTESIACSLICFLLYGLTRFKNSVGWYIVLTVLLLLGLLTRPTGILSLVATLLFLLSRNWKWFSSKPVIKFSMTASIVIILSAGAYLMFSIWDFSEQYIRGNIVTYMDSIEGESQYYEQLRLPAKDLIPPDPSERPFFKMVQFVFYNPVHFIKAAGLKIFYLMAGIRPYYSTIHNFSLIIFLGVIYSMSYIGYPMIFNKEIKVFILALTAINCLLIGIATVDWDNRFYVPMVPGFVLLSTGGFLKLINNFFGAESGEQRP